MMGDDTNDFRLIGGTKELKQNDPNYKFKIECAHDNFTLSCGNQSQWKFAVRRDLQLGVGFAKEKSLSMPSYIQDLRIKMDMTFGEDAFQLHVSSEKLKSKTNQLKFDPVKGIVVLHESREISEQSAAGLKTGRKDFTFIIGKKWLV